ncbi:phage tail fiber domain-containing protein [Achromobacter aegrifaciens]
MTTTIYQPWADYTADGVTKRYAFGFPYLARSHIMVTRNGGAPALFKFIDDHTVEVFTLYGEPIPKGEPLKIFRLTPDLDAFANFKDAALLTADDLNRARLQVLYIIQERSGGLSGSVAAAVAAVVNEIESVSGALSDLQYIQGQLLAGLQTLDVLGARMEVIEDGQAALQDLIDETIKSFEGTTGIVVTRLDKVEAEQNNLRSSVSSQIATLAGNDMAFASRVDTVEAKIDAVKQGPDRDDDVIASSIITSTIAEAKSHYSQARTLETLKAQFGDVDAMIQTEKNVRADADSALAKQITQLQVQIGENLAQVIQDMNAEIDSVGGRVTRVESNASLKTMAQRPDGRQVYAGIGLNSTASDDYTGSEIVLAAERVVFVSTADPNGALKPMFMSGIVDGSPSIVIPSNIMGDRMYPGRLLVDGTIEGRSVKANTLTGDHLVAGTIKTNHLEVGLGANLLHASEFTEKSSASEARGWYLNHTSNIQRAWIAPLYDMVNYALLGGHTIGIWQGPTNNDTNIASSWSEFYCDTVSVTAGTRYEFSVYAAAHNCTVDMGVVWYDVNGVALASSGYQLTPDQTSLPPNTWWGGNALAYYKRLGTIATAPAGAAQVRLYMRKGCHNSALSGNSYAFFTRPFLAETGPAASRLSPYTPSGLRTVITPGGISTPSLSALSANLGFLMSGTPGGLRTEMDGAQIRVYDSNNVLRVRMGIW